MFSINGVPMDNSSFGWVFRDGSMPLPAIEPDETLVRVPGRDGAVVAPVTVGPPTVMWRVETPLSSLETLLAVFGAPEMYVTETAVPTRRVKVSLVSAKPTETHSAGQVVVLTIILRLNWAYWKEAAPVTSSAVSLGSASVSVPGLFPGLSGPVQDGTVRVRGAVSGLQVSDAGGSWFTFAGSLTGSQYLRFEMEMGRAWVTTSDVWTGGTEVSGQVDFGGPRGVFEITPQWSSDPSVRAGVLTVATTSRSGAQIQVRGRSAYRV